MPFQRTPGVCLRKIDFSETSQVLRFLTRDQGRISCVAKGSKRRKGPFPAPFDILGIYDLVRIEKRPGTLDILTQAERLRTFPRLAADFGRFAAGCYAAEFADEFSPEGIKVEGLYELLVEVLGRLGSEMAISDATYSFEARGLKALGYFPRARECGVCRKPVRRPDVCFSVRDGGALCVECRPKGEHGVPVRWATLESIARFGEGEMPKEPMRRTLVEEIRQVLDACVRYHLDRELLSARFVRAPLAAPSEAPGPEGA